MLLLLTLVCGQSMYYLGVPDTLAGGTSPTTGVLLGDLELHEVRPFARKDAVQWNYAQFKSLVEAENGELSADEDVRQLKKMKCACTFKKLFVNTIEPGFTDLMIGKITRDPRLKKQKPTDVHVILNEKKKKKKKAISPKIKHLFDDIPMRKVIGGKKGEMKATTMPLTTPLTKEQRKKIAMRKAYLLQKQREKEAETKGKPKKPTASAKGLKKPLKPGQKRGKAAGRQPAGTKPIKKGKGASTKGTKGKNSTKGKGKKVAHPSNKDTVKPKLVKKLAQVSIQEQRESPHEQENQQTDTSSTQLRRSLRRRRRPRRQRKRRNQSYVSQGPQYVNSPYALYQTPISQPASTGPYGYVVPGGQPLYYPPQPQPQLYYPVMPQPAYQPMQSAQYIMQQPMPTALQMARQVVLPQFEDQQEQQVMANNLAPDQD